MGFQVRQKGRGFFEQRDKSKEKSIISEIKENCKIKMKIIVTENTNNKENNKVLQQTKNQNLKIRTRQKEWRTKFKRTVMYKRS